LERYFDQRDSMRSPLRFAQGLDRNFDLERSSALNSTDVEDPHELSDVSFLSRDREFVDTKHFSDDSDEDGIIERRRHNAIFYGVSLCVAFVLFGLVLTFQSLSGSRSGGTLIWTSSTAWGEPTEDFVDLGQGLCMGVQRELIPKFNTSYPLELFHIASLSDCQNQCRQDPACSGYARTVGTFPSRCSLVFEDDGFPASADGNTTFQCFWRHKWLHNSEGIYDVAQPNVPKIIWTYWENIHQENPNYTKQAQMHSLLGLCELSWRRLNPGWTVRVLNQDTFWNYISREDLPQGFDSLKIQHRSDAIRLALLVKYGGVWLDATVLLLRPLSMFIQEADPSSRFFYVNRGLQGLPTVDPTKYSEKRYTADFHVENWFFAVPPKDPLMIRTLNCVKRLHQEGDTKHLTDYRDVFTNRQIDDLHALGEWAYIATDACIFKTLDEDRALTQWWLSPKVRRKNFLGHLDPQWFANYQQTMVDLFYKVNPAIVQVLTGGELLLLKFTTEMRKALIDPISPLEMYGCVESSWSIVLAAIGLANISKCDVLRVPGANNWTNTTVIEGR